MPKKHRRNHTNHVRWHIKVHKSILPYPLSINKCCHRWRLQRHSMTTREKKKKMFEILSTLFVNRRVTARSKMVVVVFICIRVVNVVAGVVRPSTHERRSRVHLPYATCFSTKFSPQWHKHQIRIRHTDTLLRVQAPRAGFYFPFAFAFANFRFEYSRRPIFFFLFSSVAGVHASTPYSIRRLPADCLLREEKVMKYFRFIWRCFFGVARAHAHLEFHSALNLK